MLKSAAVVLLACALFSPLTAKKTGPFKSEPLPNHNAGNNHEPGAINATNDVSPSIVGGTAARRRQFPWFASLIVDNNVYFCGGSLISRKCILTTGLCLYKATSVDVRIGSIDREIDEDGEIHQTSKVFVIHPSFKHEPEVRNDLGILILSTPIKLNRQVNIIRLPRLSDVWRSFRGIDVVVAGFGLLHRDDPKPSRTLQYVGLKVISKEVCQQFYPPDRINNAVFCTSGRRNRTACYEDNGGPVIYRESDKRWTQIGILAHITCSSSPSLNTRVTAFLRWIAKTADVNLRQ